MDRRTFLKLAGAGIVAFGTGGTVTGKGHAASQSKADPRYAVADSHFHFLDFIQQTEGMEPLIRAMNDSGVEHIMFSGMPLIKKWHKDEPLQPTYYLEDSGRTYWYSATDFVVARRCLEVPEPIRRRFHPFICGFNATDMHAILHVERMLSEFPGLWHGIGEIFGHRDDLTNLTYGETARANHPALDAVYDLAAQRRLPVNLHNNATSRSRLDRPIYVHEVKDALARHPRTTIIWAHAGLSRYLDLDQPAYTSLLREMLQNNKNLRIDLSWIVFENYILAKGSNKEIRPEWLALVSDFPERFMIGSDNIGHYGTYRDNITKYYALLDALEPEKARLVARENFLELMPT